MSVIDLDMVMERLRDPKATTLTISRQVRAVQIRQFRQRAGIW
jgi:hypothetical protein